MQYRFLQGGLAAFLVFVFIISICISSDPLFSLYLGSFLILVLLLLPLSLRYIKSYEPIVALGAMIFLFAMDLVYMAVTGLSRAEHLRHSFIDLIPVAGDIILFTSAWYFLFFLGYALVRKVPERIANGEPILLFRGFTNVWLVYTSVICCFLIGLFNLFYNIWLFDPNKPFQYLLEFGVSRHRDQVNPGLFTTVGYNLFIVALILYRVSFTHWRATSAIMYTIMAFVAMLAILSRGQIFHTFSVFIFIFIIEYFLSFRRDQSLKIAVVALPLIVVCILLAYAMRLVSVELYLAEETGESLETLDALAAKLAQIIHLIFAKGNVPNLPAMLVFWDHYGTIEPYLYGESLISWVGAFVPNMSVEYLANHVSDVWYPNHVGGIPPGIILELFANFGFLGALASAFVFGGVSALIFNFFMKRRSLILGIIYAALIIRFWFILPKVESAGFSNAVWLFMPTILVLFLGLTLDRAISKR